MRFFVSFLFYVFFVSINSLAQSASQEIWTFIGTEESSSHLANLPSELPQKFALFRFNRSAFLDLIEDASRRDGGALPEVLLPLPSGHYYRFRFTPSIVMEDDLLSSHPDIKTFRGWQKNDASINTRFDLTPQGFHAQIQERGGLLYISPLTEDIYISYYAKDFLPLHDFGCEFSPRHTEIEDGWDASHRPFINYGSFLRTYRVAVAATGEYTQAVGGTKALALASIATAINFLNGIYELEVSVRLIIVANNINVIYTNPVTDPYTPEAGNNSMLAQNQTTITNVIGAGNYDIGHVVHARAGSGNSGSGVASLAAVCRSASKARGVTTASRIGLLPINPFFYRVLLHEIGHQFGAHHSFNASCNGNRTDATAFEPGGGSTIMSYAGGCSPLNVQTLADTYFHRISLEEISTFLNGFGSTCDGITNTGNAIPTAEAGPNYIVPKATPFVLSGIGTDTNPNVLTYGWEQYNNEIAPMPPQSTSLVGPNFRSFTPSISPNRYFPRLQDILANNSPTWEVLPAVGRVMNFSLVVRDGVGGASSDNMTVTFNNNSGPFVVTSPNGGEIGIGPMVVRWNPANTQLAPINATQVDILLSLDNGNTFPLVLANNTPNDGSQSIVLPAVLSTLARIQVRAEGNIFFDISNSPFTILLASSEEQPKEISNQQ